MLTRLCNVLLLVGILLQALLWFFVIMDEGLDNEQVWIFLFFYPVSYALRYILTGNKHLLPFKESK